MTAKEPLPEAIRWLTVTAHVLALILVTSAPAEGGRKRSKEDRDGLEVPKAQIARELPIRDVFIVRVGFRLAFQRIHEVPACAALFAGLDLDGPTALRSTFYSRPRHQAEEALCEGGALAVTRVGRSGVSLCPNFRRLGREGVAAILIHEALHTAGLDEWPVDPDGPTSGEITRTVLAACSLP